MTFCANRTTLLGWNLELENRNMDNPDLNGLTMLTTAQQLVHLAFPTHKWNVVNSYVRSFLAVNSNFWGKWDLLRNQLASQ